MKLDQVIIVYHVLQVLWIRLRCLILRGLGQAVILVPKPMLNDMKSKEHIPNTSSLEETTAALEELLADIEKHPGLQDKVLILKWYIYSSSERQSSSHKIIH
jgi:hypothetical protein